MNLTLPYLSEVTIPTYLQLLIIMILFFFGKTHSLLCLLFIFFYFLHSVRKYKSTFSDSIGLLGTVHNELK